MSLIKLPAIVFLFVCFKYGACNGDSEESKGSFYLGIEKVSRDQAVQLCEERDMKLVSIQTPEKNLALAPFLKENGVDYPVWVSGHKNSDGETWNWLDGEVIKYFYWGPAEPNAARENETCMEVYQKYTLIFWNDQPCEDKRGFICEKINKTCPLSFLQSSRNGCDTELISASIGDEVCSISTKAPIRQKKRFYASSQKATRAEALKQCSEMYMQLARMRDAEENNALFEFLREKGSSGPYWSAGNRRPGHHWEWLNDEPITYYNWAPGEPNSVGNVGICLEVFTSDHDLLWNDQYCTDERHFVCEQLVPVVNIIGKGNLAISGGTSTGGNKCSVVVNMM